MTRCQSYQSSRRTAWWSLAAAGLAALSPISLAGTAALERELRCCVQWEVLRGRVLVVLTGDPRPVAQLRVTTPDGVVVGYDPGSRLFHPPTAAVWYASVHPHVPELAMREWLRQRERVLALDASAGLTPGDYRLEVLGVVDGFYTLQFQPAGYGDTSASQSFARVPIKAGQSHRYRFRAPFADPHDGSLPPDDPRRFKALREP